jgi:hypothetical protein
MAGIAETRADAIRWALARIRERPAYEQLLKRIAEIEGLRAEFSADLGYCHRHLCVPRGIQLPS